MWKNGKNEHGGKTHLINLAVCSVLGRAGAVNEAQLVLNLALPFITVTYHLTCCFPTTPELDRQASNSSNPVSVRTHHTHAGV